MTECKVDCVGKLKNLPNFRVASTSVTLLWHIGKCREKCFSLRAKIGTGDGSALELPPPRRYSYIVTCCMDSLF